MATTITHEHGRCIRSFNELCSASDNEDNGYCSRAQKSQVLDEYGRFNVWSGNIGAHQVGRVSLDHRLREAEHVKSQVITLLQYLRETLDDATSIVNRSRTPYEEASPSPDSDSSEEEQSSETQTRGLQNEWDICRNPATESVPFARQSAGCSGDGGNTRSPSTKRHKCPYCTTDFTRHHNLKSHLLTHSHEKPYSCDTCEARFRRLHDLKRHTTLHTGERPHICPRCNRSFARGDALARHTKGQGECAGRRSSMGSSGSIGMADCLDTEMQQLVHGIGKIVANLFKLSTMIRKGNASHDRLLKSSKIDVSYYEPYDVQHAGNRFPSASRHLIERMGRANSRRRQYLKYREQHHDKLAMQITSSAIHIMSPNERIDEPQALTVETSEEPPILQATGHTAGSQHGNSLVQSTQASTFVPSKVPKPINLDVDVYSEADTQTSHATSVVGEEKLRVPPPPSASKDGRDFECPYCYSICRLNGKEDWQRKREWKRHVYKDLQPYMCTFDSCINADKMFDRRRDWFNHELQVHRREWCCNVADHPAYQEKAEFAEHMQQFHEQIESPALIALFERSISTTTTDSCPFCLGNDVQEFSVARLERHLARHMELLALFTLHSSTETGSGSSAESGLHVGASRGSDSSSTSNHGKDDLADMGSTLSSSQIEFDTSDDRPSALFETILHSFCVVEEARQSSVPKQLLPKREFDKVSQLRPDRHQLRELLSRKIKGLPDGENEIGKFLTNVYTACNAELDYDGPSESRQNFINHFVFDFIRLVESSIHRHLRGTVPPDDSLQDTYHALKELRQSMGDTFEKGSADTETTSWDYMQPKIPVAPSTMSLLSRGLVANRATPMAAQASEMVERETVLSSKLDELINYLNGKEFERAITGDVERLVWAQERAITEYHDGVATPLLRDGSVESWVTLVETLIDMVCEALQTLGITTHVLEGAPEDAPERYIIKCVCGYGADDGNTVYCEHCDTWQHTECYFGGGFGKGLTPEELKEYDHFCSKCKPRPFDNIGAAEPQSSSRNAAPLKLTEDFKNFVRWTGENCSNQLARHKEILSMREPGTSTWFLDSEQFHSWTHNDHQRLYVEGNHTCGKTLLSAAIIENLENCKKQQEAPAKIGIAFYYHQRKSGSSHAVFTDVQRSLLTQYCSQLKDIPKQLDIPLRRFLSIGTQPSDSEMSRFLKNVVQSFDTCWLVVDGIDEAPEDLRLNKEYWNLSFNVFTLLSSTPRAKHLFRHDAIKFVIKESHVAEDVALMLNRNLTLPIEIKDQMVNGILRQTHGSFVWAVSQMRCLQDCQTESQMRNVLTTTPPQIYNRWLACLSHISNEIPGLKEPIQRLLGVLSVSLKALSHSELEYIFKSHIDPKATGKDDLDILINRCSSFVAITYPIYRLKGREGEHFKLAHPMMKSLLHSPAWGDHESGLHLPMAKCCLACLVQIIEPLHPFYRYSALYWMEHTSQADSASLLDLILDLFTHKNCFTAWLSVYDPIDSTGSETPSPLYYACLLGLPQIVSQLLDQGARLDQRGGKYSYPLHAAAVSGDDNIIRLLLKHGADIDMSSENRGTALITAAGQGKESTIQLLLESGADIEMSSENRGTALITAVRERRETAIQLLLVKGANVNAPSKNGDTALFLAACEGEESVVRLLLEFGAEVNVISGDEDTALIIAAMKGKESIIQLLLKHGGDPNMVGGQGRIALHLAAGNHLKDAVPALLESGSDVDLTDAYGQTPMFYLFTTEEFENTLFDLFLAFGADITCRDYRGRTMLHVAAMNSCFWGLCRLIQAGAEVDCQDLGHGATPLWWAASKLYVDIVSYLLGPGGADPDLRNQHSGKTCLQYVVDIYCQSTGDTDRTSKAVQITEAFLLAGADQTVKDDAGLTVLDRARADPTKHATLLHILESDPSLHRMPIILQLWSKSTITMNPITVPADYFENGAFTVGRLRRRAARVCHGNHIEDGQSVRLVLIDDPRSNKELRDDTKVCRDEGLKHNSVLSYEEVDVKTQDHLENPTV